MRGKSRPGVELCKTLWELGSGGWAMDASKLKKVYAYAPICHMLGMRNGIASSNSVAYWSARTIVH